MILINPPVVKPCEAPAGLAKLAGALRHHSVTYEVLDANARSLLGEREAPGKPSDAWTRRAFRHHSKNLLLLRSRGGYENLDRYKQAVLGINHVLETQAFPSGVRLSLSNYEDERLSPLKSRDLIRAAEETEKNPLFLLLRDRLEMLLAKSESPIVGFSLNYLSQALCTFAMMGFLKRLIPSAKVVLGGSLVTSWMRRPGWENPFGGLVDQMVAGPGEAALLSLAGVAEPSGDSALDYQGFPLHDYLAPGLILPYSASRGCYWQRCSFCPERTEQNPYCPIPADRVLSEVESLAKKWNPVLIHFLDNAMSPALLKALAEHPPGVPWYGFARMTHHLADPGFCTALRAAGCVMLKLGLESGDQAVLDRLDKGIDLETASRVLRALSQSGIGTYVYLLFGTPWETLEGAERTLEFTVKHSDAIDFLNLAVFNMPARSVESDQFASKDFYEGDLSLYREYIHPRGWDRPVVRQFLDKKFKRHPAVAAILRKDPPFFTSNHAPFFCSAMREAAEKGRKGLAARKGH